MNVCVGVYSTHTCLFLASVRTEMHVRQGSDNGFIMAVDICLLAVDTLCIYTLVCVCLLPFSCTLFGCCVCSAPLSADPFQIAPFYRVAFNCALVCRVKYCVSMYVYLSVGLQLFRVCL